MTSENPIPPQYREIVLTEWQQHIVDNAKQTEERTINVVVSPSISSEIHKMVNYMRTQQIGRDINFGVLEGKAAMFRLIMKSPISKCYLFYLPNNGTENPLTEHLIRMECIKDGYAYDLGKGKDKYFDTPNVWVFTDRMPAEVFRSHDKWVFWNREDGKLCRIDTAAHVDKKQKTDNS